MTQSDTDLPTIRRTVRETLDAADGDGVARADLVSTVAAITDAAESDIESQIDALEKHGFVYLVNEEVRKT